jgi:hypothetical protein
MPTTPPLICYNHQLTTTTAQKTETNHIGYGDSRPRLDVNTSMAGGIIRHVDLDIGQTTTLRHTPLQSRNPSIRSESSGVKHHVLHERHEAGLRGPILGIVSVDERVAVEPSRRLDHRRVNWVSDNERADSEVECAPQLVCTTRKIDLSRVSSDTGALTASTAAIIVDGFLQAGSLVAGAVIFCTIIQNITPDGVVVVSSCIRGISARISRVVLFSEPVCRWRALDRTAAGRSTSPDGCG